MYFTVKTAILNTGEIILSPVFIILHNPETGLTLWQKVDPELVVPGKNGAWSLEIPQNNVLCEAALPYLARGIASDPRSVRRFRMSLDMPLLREIAEQSEAYMSVTEWVNKTLNFRTTEIRYNDPDKDTADHIFETWLPAHTIGQFIDYYFPWLSCSYIDAVDEQSGEVAEHRLQIELNELGKAFLKVEHFFEHGPEDREDPAPVDPEDYMDEEEWQEYQYRQALERDWEDEHNRGRD